MLDESTKNNDSVERRCVIIRPGGQWDEEKIVLTDKKAIAEIVGGEAEYKGEMKGKRIGFLGAKDCSEMEVNDLGFPLEPDNGPLKGVLIAFRIGEDDKPIDIDKNRYKKARRSFFKNQAKEEKKEEEEVKEEEADKEEDLSESLEVHLNGLPYEVTEEEIRQFFDGCGKIEEVRLSRYQDTNRCRGYGFVRFSSAEDVKKALEKDHAQLGTRYIEVTYARKRETTPSQPTVVPLDCRSIFVKNLPYDADEEAIKNVFMRFGKISNVRVPRHTDTGRMKGICYVEYMNGQSVKQAVAMSNQVEMGGRKLFIDVETGKPKSSFRTNEGRLWSHEHKSEKRAERPGRASKAKRGKSEWRVCCSKGVMW